MQTARMSSKDAYVRLKKTQKKIEIHLFVPNGQSKKIKKNMKKPRRPDKPILSMLLSATAVWSSSWFVCHQGGKKLGFNGI